MEEYQALALKLGLSEDDILEAAMMESQKEAKQLADHIDLLDDGLRQAGKERLAVPGCGDCQYLAFIEAAKEHWCRPRGLARGEGEDPPDAGKSPRLLWPLGRRSRAP